MSRKRFNITFNMSDEEARRAYDRLSIINFKSEFVIKAINAYVIHNSNVTRSDIKEIFRELMKDYNLEVIQGDSNQLEDEHTMTDEELDLFII